MTTGFGLNLSLVVNLANLACLNYCSFRAAFAPLTFCPTDCIKIASDLLLASCLILLRLALSFKESSGFPGIYKLSQELETYFFEQTINNFNPLQSIKVFGFLNDLWHFLEVVEFIVKVFYDIFVFFNLLLINFLGMQSFSKVCEVVVVLACVLL